MSRIFPKSCGGLAISAVFISASVVQLIAGLILLHSNYAYILSAPNFWTATMNFIVGCLLGVSASVWKHQQNQKYSILISQYKLTAALQISAIIGNASTCIILILSEGSNLVSIVIERQERNSAATINSELLGYAFAASVVSPALCIAVCAASLVTNCCPWKTQVTVPKILKPPTKSNLRSALKSSNYFEWIYTPEDFMIDKASVKSFSAPSTGSDCDYGFTPRSLYFASPPEQKNKNRCCQNLANASTSSSSPFLDDVETPSSFYQTPNASFASPLAGEIVPIRLGGCYKSSRKIGKSVFSPVPPDHWSSETLVKTPFLSFTPSPSITENLFPTPKSNNRQKSPSYLSPVQSLKEEFSKHSPQQEKQAKCCDVRSDKSKKLRPMTAIMEDAQEVQDAYKVSTISPSNRTSDYGSSPDISRNSSRLPSPPPRLTSKLTMHVNELPSKKRLFHDNDYVEDDVWI